MNKTDFKKQYKDIYGNHPQLLSADPPGLSTMIGLLKTGFAPIKDTREVQEMLKSCETQKDFEKVFAQTHYKALTRSPELIMMVVSQYPRAFTLYDELGISIDNKGIKRALERNPRVFELLQEDKRNDPEILNVYRRENLSRGLNPCSLIDPQTYYSAEAFKSCYAEFLRKSSAVYSTRDNPYKLNDINESPEKRFIDQAIKANPEFKYRYDIRRQEVFQENITSFVYAVHTEPTYFKNANIYWLTQGSEFAPSITEDAIRKFRDDQMGFMRMVIKEGRYGREFSSWLERQLDEHEEMKLEHKMVDKDEGERVQTKTDAARLLEENEDLIKQAIEEGKISTDEIISALQAEGLIQPSVEEIDDFEHDQSDRSL